MNAQNNIRHVVYPTIEDNFYILAEYSMLVLNVIFDENEYTYSKDPSTLEIPLIDLINHYLIDKTNSMPIAQQP